MRKILKWVGIGLGLVIGLVVIAVIGTMLNTDARLNKTYTIADETIPAPTDPATLARGKRWAQAYCADCHGDNLAGVNKWLDIPNLITVDSANLTSGKGGVGREFKDTDWVRAIRHGVDPEGKPMLMPASADYYYLGDQDLAAIIAYVKTVPPVDHETQDLVLSPPGKILYGIGAFGNLAPAETIPHNVRPAAAPQPGVTAQYGEYLVNTGGCRACHGPQFAGGKDPNPAAPPVPGLGPGSDYAKWTDADWIKAMRTGITPSGKALTDFMPWKSVGQLTDEELKAIYQYLKTLPGS
ncbi:MAG: cytochrome c [Anaerolineae bacterium]